MQLEEIERLSKQPLLSDSAVQEHFLNGLEPILKEPEKTEETEAENAPKASQRADANQDKKSQATRLIDLAAKAKLWHAPEGEAYATVPVADHHEHHRLRQKGFKQWLARQYYKHCKGAPSAQALNDALGVLEATAQHDGDERPVYVRVAEHDGKIYLDLANEKWEAVEISTDGWNVIDSPPVAFRRSRGMLALPYPLSGGSVDRLIQYVNLDPKDDHAWRLLVACLLAMFRPKGPYPILIFHGEQGSAKSTTLKIIRTLVDPNKSLLRTSPRDERDLMIAANNGWILSYDNLSRLESWLSDGFCRLSTGGGLATRELYSDNDELIIDAQRPVVFNGIEELATRGDLLDRAVLFNLPTITRENRKTEADFWKQFEQDRPSILGALLDAVSGALRSLATTTMNCLPRMADFATWATAAEESLGWEPGAFMKAYAANQEEANDMALGASPIAEPLKEFVRLRTTLGKGWEGTATALLEALNGQGDDQVKRLKSWPSAPRGLSNALRRLAPCLRSSGIALTFSRTSRASRITIEQICISSTLPTSATRTQAFQMVSSVDESVAKQPSVASGVDSVAGGVDGVADQSAHLHSLTKRNNRASVDGVASVDGLPLRSSAPEQVEVFTDVD